MYIQVAETLQEAEALESKLNPLMEIKDNYEKLILTMDKSPIKSYDGIKVRNLIEFLQELY